jgi:hypothetical protein
MLAERIDIGFCHPGMVDGRFAASLAEQVRDLEYHGAMGSIHQIESSLLVHARNAVVKQFLTTSSSPWLWFVDSDMIFDVGHPQKLWEVASEHDVKMVSGIAFIFRDGNQPVPSIFYPGPKEDPGAIRLALNKLPEEPEVVVATGFASVLIHRDVFETMQPARHPQYRWFDLLDITTNDGIAGEDVSFFLRAKEFGFDLMVNPDAETGHIKNFTLSKQDFIRYWELQESA